VIDLPPAERVEHMSGTEVLEVLRAVLDQERTECAELADGMAERLARSGKYDQAQVALEIGAKIRARR
jgi:hypothetical protein